MLSFSGHAQFRQRLILATLAHTPVTITDIRADDTNPGIRDHEAGFLRLLESVTNGAVIEVGYTGTSIVYRPGVLIGGKVVFDCGVERCIGYYLEALVALAPFTKDAMVATLTGITSGDDRDISVDIVRTVTLPLMKNFGVAGAELKITKRGAAPLGGGHIQFLCPNVKALTPLQLTDPGRVSRIRGIAVATRVSPQTANRIVDAAKTYLTHYIPDVFIYTDHLRGEESGLSPGYGLVLVAETTSGAFLGAEEVGTAGGTPEDAAQACATRLLDEIQSGGCVDRAHQWLAVLWMCCSPEDVCKVRTGALTPFTMQYMRDLRAFFGITFRVQEEEQRVAGMPSTVVVTGLGTGYVNVSRKTA